MGQRRKFSADARSVWLWPGIESPGFGGNESGVCRDWTGGAVTLHGHPNRQGPTTPGLS